METDNIARRLKLFMDHHELTNSQFADSCGIPRPNLSQLLSGRNKKVSDVVIAQIHNTYPELSVLWLLFGEGQMINETKKDNFVEKNSESHNTSKSVPNNLDLFSDIPDGTSEINKEENLNPVKVTPSNTQLNVNKTDIALPNAVELIKQIDKLKKNPRKVLQIMVYYDDSTFETFYPNTGK